MTEYGAVSGTKRAPYTDRLKVAATITADNIKQTVRCILLLSSLAANMAFLLSGTSNLPHDAALEVETRQESVWLRISWLRVQEGQSAAGEHGAPMGLKVRSTTTALSRVLAQAPSPDRRALATDYRLQPMTISFSVPHTSRPSHRGDPKERCDRLPPCH